MSVSQAFAPVAAVRPLNPLSAGPRITLSAVAKQYSQGRKILSDISFKVSAGEILCVVGKSGCGKSTLLHLISGQEQLCDGSIAVLGTVGSVPQKDVLLPWRTVLENVLLPLELKGSLSEAAFQQAYVCLADVGLCDSQQLYPEQLSGGMRQRLALARAMLHDADILLLDEPFSSIDFDARLNYGKSIRTWIRSRKKLAIIVTHHIDEAIALGDRVIVLSADRRGIAESIAIELPEEQRDPISVRQAASFPRYFETIWKAM